MYILECSDGSYYTGSTKNLDLRLSEHQAGEGSNHTRIRLPVKLIYFEEYNRIEDAFYREKQVQGWSRMKKEALINDMPDQLHELARCMNKSSHLNHKQDSSVGFDSAQPAESALNGSEAFEDCWGGSLRSRRLSATAKPGRHCDTFQ